MLVALKNVWASSCRRNNEFKALFNFNKKHKFLLWAVNLFILTLKLSFDDIQIGPRNKKIRKYQNTHEMYTQKNIFEDSRSTKK